MNLALSEKMLQIHGFPTGYRSNKAKSASANQTSNVYDEIELNATSCSSFPLTQEQYN